MNKCNISRNEGYVTGISEAEQFLKCSSHF